MLEPAVRCRSASASVATVLRWLGPIADWQHRDEAEKTWRHEALILAGLRNVHRWLLIGAGVFVEGDQLRFRIPGRGVCSVPSFRWAT